MSIRRTGPRRRQDLQRRQTLQDVDPMIVLQLEYQFFQGAPLDELREYWQVYREAIKAKWAAGHTGPCFAERFFDQGECEAAAVRGA